MNSIKKLEAYALRYERVAKKAREILEMGRRLKNGNNSNLRIEILNECEPYKQDEVYKKLERMLSEKCRISYNSVRGIQKSREKEISWRSQTHQDTLQYWINKMQSKIISRKITESEYNYIKEKSEVDICTRLILENEECHQDFIRRAI